MLGRFISRMQETGLSAGSGLATPARAAFDSLRSSAESNLDRAKQAIDRFRESMAQSTKMTGPTDDQLGKLAGNVDPFAPMIAKAQAAATIMTSITLAIESRLTAMAAVVTTMGQNAGAGFYNTFIPRLNEAVAMTGAVGVSLQAIFVSIASTATVFGDNAGQGFLNPFRAALNVAVSHAGAAQQSFQSIFSGIAADATNLGRAAGEGFRSGVASGMGGAVNAAQSGAGQIRAALTFGSLYGNGFSLGQSLGQGIAAGIGSMVQTMAATAAQAVTTTINAARAAADAKSPSRKARKLVGRPIGQGVEYGIVDMIPNIRRAAERAVDAAVDVDAGRMGLPTLQMAARLASAERAAGMIPTATALQAAAIQAPMAQVDVSVDVPDGWSQTVQFVSGLGRSRRVAVAVKGQ
jgi:hypothetical protein